jgi:hypothetical protein
VPIIPNTKAKSSSISLKSGFSEVKNGTTVESTGYCLGCNAQLSFCGIPFTANLTCNKCGAVNIYEDSQQPIRLATQN